MKILFCILICIAVLVFEYKLKFMTLKISVASFILFSMFIETICHSILYAAGGLPAISIYCGVLLFRHFHHSKLEGYVDKNKKIKISEVLNYFVGTSVRIPQILFIIAFGVIFKRFFDGWFVIWNFICYTNIVNNLVYIMFSSKNFREKVSS